MPKAIGPVQLRERGKGSEATAPQVRTRPVDDSRLSPEYSNLTYRCIRELREDPTVQLARWAVLSPMIHTPWVYEHNIGRKPTKRMLRFVEENFGPIRDFFLSQAVFGALDFGWQPFEIVYKTDGKRIYVERLKALLQDYTQILIYLNTGNFAGFTNQAATYIEEQLLTERYACNINFSAEGTDWYGSSVYKSLRSTIANWNDVNKAANRYDRKIAGATWVIYYPVGNTPYNGVSTPNDQIAKALLDSLESSGNVAIPDEIQDWVDDTIDHEAKGKWRIELISSDSSSAQNFIDRQKYLDALKMRAFGLPERAILEGSHGTKAESVVHGDIALSIVDSRHRLLTYWVNLYVVPQLMLLNFGEEYKWSVKVKPAPLVDTQFATVKDIYRLILSNGDALLQEAQNIDMKALRDELGIPTGPGLAPVPPPVTKVGAN